MATSFDDFWGKSGPGLLDFGTGLYNKNAAQKEAASRLATAQGPLYQQAMGGAGSTLAEAGTFNPDALAASRFGAQEAMLKPLQDKQLADLQRMLYAKGMLGIANYNPSTVTSTGEQISIAPTGQPMNPQLAAFFAAQNADRAKRSQASLLEGQGYANNLVSRANALQGIAGNTQQTGLIAQNPSRPGGIPSKATGNAELLKGAVGLFKQNPNIFKDIGGLFSSGLDWLNGGDLASQFGGMASW